MKVFTNCAMTELSLQAEYLWPTGLMYRCITRNIYRRVLLYTIQKKFIVNENHILRYFVCF